MGRWNPHAPDRLRDAAIALFLERGFEATTVADIAARAGLTERTFFRHFADKREVLFAGSERLKETLSRALDDAPPAVSAIEAVREAVEAAARLFHGRREQARLFERLMSTHPDLIERQLIKRAALTEALASSLRRRDVDETTARFAAELGMTAFYVGFERWLRDTSAREFVDFARDGFVRLRSVVAGDVGA